MAVLNAGIGGLEHDGSIINPAVDLTTNPTFFDSNFVDRALNMTNSNGIVYMWHTPQGEGRTRQILGFRCMMYISSAISAGNLFPTIQIQSAGGKILSLTSSGLGGLVWQWRHQNGGGGTRTDASADIQVPRDALFELALIMEANRPARAFIDGNPVFDANRDTTDVTDFGQDNIDGILFGNSTSSTRQTIFMRNARNPSIYLSEPVVVENENPVGMRAQDMVLTLGAQKTTGNGPTAANVDRYRDPGALFTSNVTQEEFAPGERSVYRATPVGSGPPGGEPIRSLLVSISANDRRDDTPPATFFPRIRPYFRRSTDGVNTTLGTVEEDSYELWDSAANPTDGQALGKEFLQNPLTNADWVIGDFPNTEVGGRNQESIGFARIASFQPVLIYDTVPDLITIEATAEQTLRDDTLASSALNTGFNEGQLTQTLGDDTLDADAIIAFELISGEVTEFLDNLVSNISGEIIIVGRADPINLDGVTVASQAQLLISADLATQLEDVVFDSTGTLEGPTGSLTVTLGDDTLIASSQSIALATVEVTLGDDTLDSSGEFFVQGFLSVTLGNDTLDSIAGTTAGTLQGGITQTLGNDTLVSEGLLDKFAAVQVTLGDDTLASEGLLQKPAIIDVTLGGDTLDATGVLPIEGSVAVTLEGAIFDGKSELRLAAFFGTTQGVFSIIRGVQGSGLDVEPTDPCRVVTVPVETREVKVVKLCGANLGGACGVSSSLSWPRKDKDEVLDYRVDWSDRLDQGDFIITSEFFVDPNDASLGIDSQSINGPGTATVLWLSAGTDRTRYRITNRVGTQEGRVHEQTVTLRIRER